MLQHSSASCAQIVPAYPAAHSHATSFPLDGEVCGLVCSKASIIGMHMSRYRRIPIGWHASLSAQANLASCVAGPDGQGSDSKQTPAFRHGESPRATHAPPQSMYRPRGAKKEQGSSRIPHAPTGTQVSPQALSWPGMTSHIVEMVEQSPRAWQSEMQSPP